MVTSERAGVNHPGGALALLHVVLGSAPTQPRNDSARLEQLLFIIRRIWHIAAIASGFKRSIDLVESGLGRGDIPTPFGEQHQRGALSAKSHDPTGRPALAGVFLQRLTIDNDGLFELRRSALSLSEGFQSYA